MSVSFFLLQQIPTITYKEEKHILVQSFGSFRPWLVGPFAFGPVTRQHIMERVYGRAIGDQEIKSKRLSDNFFENIPQ
jgi:hypothetical protein